MNERLRIPKYAVIPLLLVLGWNCLVYFGVELLDQIMCHSANLISHGAAPRSPES